MSISSVTSSPPVPIFQQLTGAGGVSQDNDGDEATESSAEKAKEAAKASPLPADANRGRKVNISS